MKAKASYTKIYKIYYFLFLNIFFILKDRSKCIILNKTLTEKVAT